MKRKFFSVVFEVLDDDKFRETMAGFTQQLGSAGVRNGAQVTACGWGDFATQSEAYSNEIICVGGICRDVLIAHLQAEIPGRTLAQAKELAEQVDP